MRAFDLGGTRLHVLTVHPGVPGESDRVVREVSRLDPALVLLDADTTTGLAAVESLDTPQRFVASFVDDLFAQETARRFGAGERRGEHPFLGLARVTRNRRLGFVALRPTAQAPGFFARRAIAKRAARIDDVPAAQFPHAFVGALAGDFDPRADVATAIPRLDRALDDGRAPVVAVVQAHREAAYLAALEAMPRRRAP